MGVHQRSKSLFSQHNPLSDTFFQLEVLNGAALTSARLPAFSDKIKTAGFPDGRLKPTRIEIFQVNVGKLCNQSCAHCHVDAGPDRREENMVKENFDRCLDILARYDIPTVDITGGAPELNPHFRWFVEECRKLGKRVMNRCNLTVILSNPKYRDLPRFFADNRV